MEVEGDGALPADATHVHQPPAPNVTLTIPAGATREEAAQPAFVAWTPMFEKLNMRLDIGCNRLHDLHAAADQQSPTYIQDGQLICEFWGVTLSSNLREPKKEDGPLGCAPRQACQHAGGGARGRGMGCTMYGRGQQTLVITVYHKTGRE